MQAHTHAHHIEMKWALQFTIVRHIFFLENKPVKHSCKKQTLIKHVFFIVFEFVVFIKFTKDAVVLTKKLLQN